VDRAICCVINFSVSRPSLILFALLPQWAVDRAICCVIHFSASRPSLSILFALLPQRAVDRAICCVINFSVSRPSLILFFFFARCARAPLNRLGTLLIRADCDHWALGRGSCTGRW
jgi:hypothetical protein